MRFREERNGRFKDESSVFIARSVGKLMEPHALTPDKNETISMKKVSLSFSGKINADMIANSLLQILGENAVGEVEITCQLCS